MSTLYLRLPSSASAERSTEASHFACRYALVSSGRIEHEGVASVPELSATLAKVDRVTLLVAASDVTLLRLRVPPLAPARLKAALPNLVEEHLVSDPAECAIVASDPVEGMRTIAVVRRAWLETIASALAAHDARRVIAVPAQLCLPWQEGTVSAALEQSADEMALTLRVSAHEGIGIAMPASASPREVLDAVAVIARTAPCTLYAPDALLPDLRSALDADPELAARAAFAPESWSCWLDGANAAELDLFAGLAQRLGGESQWRRWRWPIALAASLVVINVVGLHADWWRMRSEADRLRADMLQTFRTAYPKETVILDPAAQMKQKLAAARRAQGQLAPDDFLVLVSRVGDAWASVARSGSGRGAPQLAALDYRERKLSMRLPPGVAMPGELASGLKARGLALSQGTAGTWQIRSAP